MAYEPQGSYRPEVENKRELCRKAREFLSLSAEQQAEDINSYFLPKTYNEAEEEEMRRKLLRILTGL